jgi:3-dehydroquinate dehydratase
LKRNINKGEPFRHKSMIADGVTGRIAGFGMGGYLLALRGVAAMVEK